jgi:hypothetical protein
MDQAFASIWNILRADDPFRDYANDSELRVTIGQKLLNLVADGVTDPGRLRQLTVESLLPGHWRAEISRFRGGGGMANPPNQSSWTADLWILWIPRGSARISSRRLVMRLPE